MAISENVASRPVSVDVIKKGRWLECRPAGPAVRELAYRTTLHRQQLRELARAEAKVELEQWKTTNESQLRQDAIQRSQAVTIGKVTEHIVPYLPGFSFNPKDVRFLGTPIDLVIFDGLCEGHVKRIVFVEVKTGTSSLSGRERLVREAVNAGKVEWLEFRPALHQGNAANQNPVVGVASAPSAPPPETGSRRRWW